MSLMDAADAPGEMCIRDSPAAFLPPEEHSLYIFEGSTTLKVFREQGALSMRLVTDVDLQPGTYVLEANFFSDVFEKYENDQKVAPSDPSAGEAALIAGSGGTGWVANNYLTRNKLSHTFTVTSAQKMTVGVGFRGRYAIANNGWFVDKDVYKRQSSTRAWRVSPPSTCAKGCSSPAARSAGWQPACRLLTRAPSAIIPLNDAVSRPHNLRQR